MPDLTTLHLPALDWMALRAAVLHLTALQIGVLSASAVVIWLSGFFSRSGGRKWRKRFEQERDFYTAYRAEADSVHQQHLRRIAALEAQLNPPQPVMAEAADMPAEAVTVEDHAVEAVEATPPDPVVATDAPETAAAMPEHPVDAPAAELADEIPPPAWAAPIAADPDMTHEAPAEVVGHDEAGDHAAPAEHDAPVADGHAAEPAQESPDAATSASDSDHQEQQHDDLGRLRGLDAGLHAKLSELGLHRYEDIEKLSAEDEMALEERLGVPVGHIAREQWRSQAALLRAGNEAEFNERYALVDA